LYTRRKALKYDIDYTKVMDILIIKLGAIGDVIRTTAILPGLKEQHKDCNIDWITKIESLDILKNNNMIDNIHSINNDLKEINEKEYDLIINLDDDNEACKLATVTKHKEIIGAYLENEKRVYTENSFLWFDMGLISKFGKKKADQLKALNKKTYQEIMYEILDLDYKKQEPILILNEEELRFGKDFAEQNNIDENSIVIGINTGAGGRWKDKRLSEELTSELIDKLNEIKNVQLLLFGGPEEKERNEEIKKSVTTKIIDAGCDNSLMEFASLVNLCNILVTSDSLAMHIGTALKKKIIAFFYPTSADEILLPQESIKIIGKGNSYCSYQKDCDSPPKWDTDEIVDAVKKLK
jgi:heptosyltransferase II